jgi:hypothetical protein
MTKKKGMIHESLHSQLLNRLITEQNGWVNDSKKYDSVCKKLFCLHM